MPASDPVASREFAAAVRAAQAVIRRLPDPHARVRAYGELLAALQEQVLAVTEQRDQELSKLLRQEPRPSNRSLAEELGMSRQRVDQLARQLRFGRRQRHDA